MPKFEKVFVIGLPERSDKRDALTLMSSLTGFRLSWIDGVAGNTIPNKALPFVSSILPTDTSCGITNKVGLGVGSRNDAG